MRVKKNLIVAVLVILAFILGLNVVLQYPGIWLLGLSVMLIPIVFFKYELGIKVAFLSVFFLDWLSDVIRIIPRQITWSYDLMILVWFIILVLMLSTRSRPYQRTVIDMFVLALIIVGFISTVANKCYIGVTIAGIRRYFKYIMFFYILTQFDLNESLFKNILKLLIIVGLIQIPVAVLQRFLYKVRTGDVVGGTLGFGTSGILTQFLMIMSILLLNFYKEGIFTLKRAIVLVMLLTIPMSINETKIFFWVFPLLVLVSFRKDVTRLKWKLVPTFIALSLLLIASYKIYTHFYARLGVSPFSWRAIRKNLEPRTEVIGKEKIWRFGAIVFAYKSISQDIVTLLLGVGPGNASESFIADWSGKYYKLYGFMLLPNFLSTFLWEYGVVGVMIFIGLLIKLLRMTNFVIKQGDSFDKAFANTYSTMIVMILLTIFYNPGLFNDTLGYTFWFFSAFVQKLYWKYRYSKV